MKHSSKNDTQKVVDLLKSELEKINQSIKAAGDKAAMINFKRQLETAIENLEFFTAHDLSAQTIEAVMVPEGGSDSYFTEFNLVDEHAASNIPENSIVKNENGEIKLSYLDVILKRKEAHYS